MRDKIIEYAKLEIGYIEKKSNKDLDSKTLNAGNCDYTKYGVWYGSDPGPWCCKFICYIFNKAKALKYIKKAAGTYTFMDFFKNNKNFFNRNFKPSKADIIFINWKSKGTPDHVGIVSSIDNTYVYTIEGNRNNRVESAKYKLTDTRILGYGHVDFKENEEKPDSSNIYEVTASNYLHVRKGPGTNYTYLKYAELECDQRLQNMEISGRKVNGLVKGVICEVLEINGNWAKIKNGYVSLDYLKKR